MKLKNKLKLISRDIFLYTLISLFIISCGNGCKYPGEDENWVETRGVELYPINLDFLNVADEGHVYLKEGATEQDAFQ